ncbi:MAG: FliM/FliN family flagellar motor switch protein [Paracoccaceae bacterium]|nr:FliM/FliN family flagellar motor switch protein [Paracoccaceae bacterium]
MADAGTASILRRKAEQGRAGAGDPKGPPAPGRALVDAFRRAAEEELALAVTTAEAREQRATPAEILEGLPEHAFLAVLIGPEDGAGLLALDPGAMAAVIEMRTMGRVSARQPTPRRPTKTDAAMVADLIDRVLSEFEAPLLETEDARWAAGWRYQLFLPEPRPLSVVLEDAKHRVLEATILFGAAAKEGRAILVLPATGRGRPVRPVPPPEESVAAETAATWQVALGDAVESAEATLDAVLGRVRLPLNELAALAPGDRLALPITALGAVRLVAAGGTTVAEARLGQTGGLRAVKIRDPEQRARPPATEGAVIGAEALARRTGPAPGWAGAEFAAAAAPPQFEVGEAGDPLADLCVAESEPLSRLDPQPGEPQPEQKSDAPPGAEAAAGGRVGG